MDDTQFRAPPQVDAAAPAVDAPSLEAMAHEEHLAEEHRARESIATMVHAVSVLSRRYEGSDAAGAPDAKELHRLGLLRGCAELGRRFLAGPAADPGAARDHRATARDRLAEERDVRATARDKRARVSDGDLDRGFPDRFLAACDRDSAAGDRLASQHDRDGAKEDRARASTAGAASVSEQPELDLDALGDVLDERAAFRRAQGVLMATRHMTPPEASEALLAASHWDREPLRDLVDRVVRGGSLPPA